MRNLMALAVVLAVPALAVAHDGHDHSAHKMMGTVIAVHADMKHVEMKEGKTGKTTGFYVTDATKILKGSTSLKLADLKIGTRVLVTATTKDGKATATEVRVGAIGKASPAADPAHKH